MDEKQKKPLDPLFEMIELKELETDQEFVVHLKMWDSYKKLKVLNQQKSIIYKKSHAQLLTNAVNMFKLDCQAKGLIA